MKTHSSFWLGDFCFTVLHVPPPVGKRGEVGETFAPTPYFDLQNRFSLLKTPKKYFLSGVLLSFFLAVLLYGYHREKIYYFISLLLPYIFSLLISCLNAFRLNCINISFLNLFLCAVCARVLYI